ncbi:MAG: arginine--tRNA ligase, partial [Candidatus Eiseniibacteriota bacterium]
MNLYRYFDQEIAKAIAALASEGVLPAGLDLARVTVEPTRDPSHGDISSNAAMVLAKPAAKKPRDIAEALARKLEGHDAIASVAVAGPGFVNIRLADSFWHARMADILKEGLGYGASDMGRGTAVNVEYVSANPTGPMHVGHGRGAVVGDALAALLEKAGYSVTREYYINDAGAQVDTLARSAHLRYREALGETVGAIPEGLYPGDYLVPVGQALAKQYGDKWQKAPEAEWLEPIRGFTIDAMLALIREDLKALGVTHKVFTSERALAKAGQVDAALKFLADRDLVYTGVLEPPKGMKPDDWEERPQTLFRATNFGDDVDRPLKKSDGSWTYFATDIAYHLDKFRRGFASMIDVWGADHGGYVKRMQAAVQAITEGKGALDVKLCQLVNLLDKGEPVKMSKRAGTFVTLREVIDEVGKDVFRFIMLTRKNDATLDFDYAKVMEKTRENPVFYVQYAHARCHSVFRNAVEAFAGLDVTAGSLAKAPLDRLTDPAELALIKRLAGWPRLVESAAETHEPHRLAFYLYDVASDFHALWNKGNEDPGLRFILDADRKLTEARLAMVRAVQLLIASGLAIIGVTPVEEL